MGDIQILLVEDNPGDVRLTIEALRGAKVANELRVLGDGESALEYLHRRGEYADAVRPDIILLDLNLPRLEGREVLARIKSDPDLATIPTIVLTSSSADIDVQQSYELHANCFVSKPVDFTEFVEAIRSFEGFWLKTVRLP
jgi:CheY-like chemotaxis protein